MANNSIPITVDAEAMFKQIAQYHYSTDVLNAEMREHIAGHCQGLPPTLTPTIMMSAFTIELYFKCIYAMENHGMKMNYKGHRLTIFFSKISTSAQNEITKVVNNYLQFSSQEIQTLLSQMGKPAKRFSLIVLPHGPLEAVIIDHNIGYKTPRLLSDVLQEADLSFENFRYAHEGNTTGYELRILENSLRHYIIGKEKTWAKYLKFHHTPPTSQAQ